MDLRKMNKKASAGNGATSGLVTNLGLKAALFSLCEKGPICAKRK